MTIWNLGSINADHVYAVDHILAPGETLAATDLTTGLGGKGANMSVACARAGARIGHIGAVGPEGGWAVDRLTEYGVDNRWIKRLDVPSGHAIITVAEDGENSIILFPGANRALPIEAIRAALAEAEVGDWFLTQNETNLQAEAAALAREMGLKVGYAAAPFDAQSVAAVLPLIDFLILNEVEAAQLEAATGTAPGALEVNDVIVTLGADGARWFDNRSGTVEDFPAIPVTPVDTTGAGDTFTGYVLAGLDRGMPMGQAIGLAMRAGALMVTRPGAADAIPDLAEVQAFLQPDRSQG
ncbi:ribokinase [Flavimaricola marinus]|uniref:Ribokinase n=1 Tax=Flavimaricola marinus TaxID=1819565 RepID=A0A238LE22_9RHOB|nr:ribokinase [Flavimaricola marinus]SMY07180.1 Ribokinase [Flavimaricola marinus]